MGFCSIWTLLVPPCVNCSACQVLLTQHLLFITATKHFVGRAAPTPFWCLHLPVLCSPSPCAIVRLGRSEVRGRSSCLVGNPTSTNGFSPQLVNITECSNKASLNFQQQQRPAPSEKSHQLFSQLRSTLRHSSTLQQQHSASCHTLTTSGNIPRLRPRTRNKTVPGLGPGQSQEQGSNKDQD